MSKTSSTTPPIAKKIPHELIAHGDTRIDNYYWLNDRKNQEVIDYLNAENTYREAEMAHTKPFQEELYKEIVGRIAQTDMSVPYHSNGYWYYTRFEEGKEYPIYCRKKGTQEAPEEILLNVNELAKGFAYYQVGGLSVSPNNKILAYGVDTVSRRQYTIYFKNLETGELYNETIVNTNAQAAWANDNLTVFYTKNDVKTLRSYKIMRHKLGTQVKGDKLIFHEKDDTFGTIAYKTKSKKYIVIACYQTISNEYWIIDADNPTAKMRCFQARERHLEYSIDHYEDNFYVITNLDAQNFRLMKTPLAATSKENWTEFIPHRKDVLLEDIEIFKNYLVLSERSEGITRLHVRSWNGQESHNINFGESAYMAGTGTNADFDTEILRLNYTSLTTPTSIYDYDMRSQKLNLLKQQEVVGNFDASKYQSERIYATANDGTKIPITMVYKKGIERNEKNPFLLYAYGSYGYSMDPTFSSVRLSLLDRGFIWAIAHIRGGQEMGRQWYEDGKLLKKRNTFTDFVDCAKHIIKEKYTNAQHLFAQGGSAGGLLMGAVINLQPDIFKGVIAQVPFVDVITTMLDESIPLTTGEFDEWGNPKDKTYYDYMKSYSPYDNVERKDYPSMLVTTGLHDSQVQYWEPAKWVAKLRDMKTDKNPLYMYCNMETGHGGASGRFERYKETAMEYAFLLDLAAI